MELHSEIAYLPPKIRMLWQKSRQSYCHRLSAIQEAVIALQSGSLTPEQQHQAKHEAHTLFGSLGSFGLEQASFLCYKIEQLLQLHETTLINIQQLVQLTNQLTEILVCNKSPEASSDSVNLDSITTSIAPLTGSLLVIDDDLALAQEMTQEAISWGVQSQFAIALETARNLLDKSYFQVILIDPFCSRFAQDGLNFLAAIKRKYPDIAVLIFTAEDTFENRVAAAKLKSHCFLQKPLVISQVLAIVLQVLEEKSQSAARILIVDDDPEFLKYLNLLLKPSGYEIILLSKAQHFWQTLEQTNPDLLILDIELSPSRLSKSSTSKVSSLSGIEICQVIRNDLRWNRLPVLFLSSHTDIETVQRSFAVEADDFLSKPVVVHELLTRVRTRLKQRNLWKINDLDELTGVSLRRKALQDLMRKLNMAQRQHESFSLAILDIDNFKQVNDQYGHDTGDRVLSYFGKLLTQVFRSEDIIGRWGGEEFVVGMYGMTKLDGIKRLENVLQKLKNYVFVATNGASFQVTFSGGIAQSLENGRDLQTLYHCADEALYRAKTEGKNRIVAALTV